MKTRRFAWISFLSNLLLVALDVYFLVDTLLRGQTGDDFFLAFCFLLVLAFSSFLMVISLKSIKKGIYYLPELMFDEDGRSARLAWIVFLILMLVALFGLGWFLCALFGVNPYVDMPRREVALLVSTTALLAVDSFLPLLYLLFFRHEPKSLKEK